VELQNAIVKMEQGGSVDGLLQVKFDYDGLVVALSYRRNPIFIPGSC